MTVENTRHHHTELAPWQGKQPKTLSPSSPVYVTFVNNHKLRVCKKKEKENSPFHSTYFIFHPLLYTRNLCLRPFFSFTLNTSFKNQAHLHETGAFQSKSYGTFITITIHVPRTSLKTHKKLWNYWSMNSGYCYPP